MTERDVRAAAHRSIRRRRKQERLTRTIVVAGVLAATVGIAVVGNRARDRGHDNDRGGGTGSPRRACRRRSRGTTTAVAAGERPPTGTVPDLAIAGPEQGLTADCKVQPKTISVQSSGVDVQCLQQALQREGYYSGAISGTFDFATSAAVEQFQIDKELFVDGVAGRETSHDARHLARRADARRAHAAAAGRRRRTRWGYPLSSVSSIGDDAPPLPENSGTGRRVVYERISQRVWAVAEDGDDHPLLAGRRAASTTTRCPARTRCTAGPSSRRRGTARRSCR